MALEGTLSYLDIAHLLQVVGTSKKTGILEISWQERRARLLFENGGLIRAESNRSYAGIGTLLVNAGVLSPERLEAALATQRDDPRRRRLGAILCDELGLETHALQQMLRRQFEDIVFDVFSWPGGTFVFQFSSPEEIEERFTIDAVEFILEVGVQAGLLADEGMGRSGADPGRVPVALLMGDATLFPVAVDTWRRKGHQVVACERVEELMGFLGQREADGLCPVALVDLDHLPAADEGRLGGCEVLDGLRSLRPEVPVVALGADSQLGVEAHRRGAGAFVHTPSDEDLRGANRDTHLEVFSLRLEKAMQKAIQKAAAADGAGAPGGA
ncbi:MAG: response regulator [Deferrisomatales bacterium]|nr:response regulator [Deferrisomatales bacterium]HSH71237.1 response regulator [Deferrisomatales bacterium]